MILTVTPNTALDLTYHLAELRPHATNRAVSVTARAGGKGLNTARVAALLGHRAAVTGLVGGAVGAELRQELAESAPGVRDALVAVAGATRRTVAMVDGTGDATIVNEPGPRITAEEWAAFRARYRQLLAGAGGGASAGNGAASADGPTGAGRAAAADGSAPAGRAERPAAVALCGSLPPGVPADAYAELIADARAAGVPVLLDTSGEALAAGVAAGPDLVKPNADELGELAGLGRPVASPAEAAEAARALPVGAVAASLGPDGMVAVADGREYRVPAPRRIAGNPVGAGDSAVAGLLTGLAEGLDWERRLRRAVALSAATVAAPVAGAFDAGVRAELERELDAPGA